MTFVVVGDAHLMCLVTQSSPFRGCYVVAGSGDLGWIDKLAAAYAGAIIFLFHHEVVAWRG